MTSKEDDSLSSAAEITVYSPGSQAAGGEGPRRVLPPRRGCPGWGQAGTSGMDGDPVLRGAAAAKSSCPPGAGWAEKATHSSPLSPAQRVLFFTQTPRK